LNLDRYKFNFLLLKLV